MFYNCYRRHRFGAAAKKTVEQSNEIIADMRRQGYTLSLRQLFYQLVRRNWIANEQKEYKRLGRLITNAREAGIVDWMAIEDRERKTIRPYINEDQAEALAGVETFLKLDQWQRQEAYIEVWVEKQALVSVVERACTPFDVPYMACKGYLSASEAWKAGRRFNEAVFQGKRPVLLHLADHDPSGLNMTDDNLSRLRLFAESNDVEIKRLALNMDQVQHYAPPPNPAKEQDSRSQAYIKQFGRNSWELDALEPSILVDIIQDEIRNFIDWDIWDDTLKMQTEIRKPLAALEGNWEEVLQFMEENGLC